MKETNLDQCLVSLGSCIRTLRLSRNLSQEAFADACKLDRSYMGGVERGERNLGIKNLLKISCALQVRPAEILDQITLDQIENGGK